MTDAQRIERIAELLCLGVMIAEAKKAVPEQMVEKQVLVVPRTTTDVRVMAYLEVAGQATPLTIRTALGVSRAAVTRALTHLHRSGEIVASGQTRTLIYRLRSLEPPPDRIGLN